MARRILVVPTNHGAGVSSVCLGLVRAIDERRVAVGYAKPFAQARRVGEDHSTELFRLTTPLRPPPPIPADHLESLLAEGRIEDLMGEVVAQTRHLLAANQVVVLEGLAPSAEQLYSDRINVEVATALDAEVLLVGSASGVSPERFAAQLAGTESIYRARGESRALGAVVNKIPLDADPDAYVAAVETRGIPVVGRCHVHPELTRPRVQDVVRELGLQVVNAGDLGRRVGDVAVAAQSVPGFLDSLTTDRLVISPGDRHDVLMSAVLAQTAGTRLAALLLTAGIGPDPEVLALARPALQAGLPVLLSQEKTFETASRVLALDTEIPADDEERARGVMAVMSRCFDEDWLRSVPSAARVLRATPAAFRLHATERAIVERCAIAFTDGADPRVVAAAARLHDEEVARCVLVAPVAAVEAASAQLGVDLPPDLRVVDPSVSDEASAAIAARFREEKQDASYDASDPLVRGLALVLQGEADGLIGGIDLDRSVMLERISTMIGPGAGQRIVTTCHFVALPDEIVVYADCVLHPHPDARDLAEIAIQTVRSAEGIGMPLRLAFIAPASSSPTVEADLRRTAEAVDLLRERRPDLDVAGPVPFDIAARRTKEPGDDGRNATVLVFPDHATANSMLKAVRRSAGVTVVGPILQGLSRSINPLTHDATPEEIFDLTVATVLKSAQLA